MTPCTPRRRPIAHVPAPLRILLCTLAGAVLFACGSRSTEAPSPTPSERTTAVAANTAFAPTSTVTPSPTHTPAPTPTPTPEPHGILDGVVMDQADYDDKLQQHPVAVMIDNAPRAYPQVGLDRADLVIEAFVEGHITRYMAVYWRQDAPDIGPVRSVRMPFVHWASELNGILASVGAANQAGEANAGSNIRNWSIPWLDFDVPTDARAFYRTSGRPAPHNVITSTSELRATAHDLGRAPSNNADQFEPWPFKEDGAGTANAPAVDRIDVRFSANLGGGTVIAWTWAPEQRAYLRHRAGAPHVDGVTGQQLTATNVIVMHMTSRIVSPYGHLVYDQLGEGPATIYLDGKRIDATWRKAYPADRTRFYGAAGTEIALNRGPTWIAMVSQASTVTETP